MKGFHEGPPDLLRRDRDPWEAHYQRTNTPLQTAEKIDRFRAGLAEIEPPAPPYRVALVDLRQTPLGFMTITGKSVTLTLWGTRLDADDAAELAERWNAYAAQTGCTERAIITE
jgi:hypothetical protein